MIYRIERGKVPLLAQTGVRNQAGRHNDCYRATGKLPQVLAPSTKECDAPSVRTLNGPIPPNHKSLRNHARFRTPSTRDATTMALLSSDDMVSRSLGR